MTAWLAAIALVCACGSAWAKPAEHAHKVEKRKAHHHHPPRIDRSGKKRRGIASYYGKGFVGKPMASGVPMDPNSNTAASRTLPLGTRARVKNLRTGKSAIVRIQDRGPYVKGRILDLTPRTARKLGIKKSGIAPVEVTPLEIPPPDVRSDIGEPALEKQKGRDGREGGNLP
ncbi:MAG: septal ring lytic transglycosylase RlpA family protein [Sulfuricella sp.]|nr:septal ring lytic transglycosylase RlpA family protein [Sulfuricella sp.]